MPSDYDTRMLMPVIDVDNEASEAARKLGAIGGSRSTPRKIAASRDNARRGWQGKAGELRRAAIRLRLKSRAKSA